MHGQDGRRVRRCQQQLSIGRNAPPSKSIPGKVSGVWLFKDTRMPVSIVESVYP
jgi:hypothetical protein